MPYLPRIGDGRRPRSSTSSSSSHGPRRAIVAGRRSATAASCRTTSISKPKASSTSRTSSRSSASAPNALSTGTSDSAHVPASLAVVAWARARQRFEQCRLAQEGQRLLFTLLDRSCGGRGGPRWLGCGDVATLSQPCATFDDSLRVASAVFFASSRRPAFGTMHAFACGAAARGSYLCHEGPTMSARDDERLTRLESEMDFGFDPLSGRVRPPRRDREPTGCDERAARSASEGDDRAGRSLSEGDDRARGSHERTTGPTHRGHDAQLHGLGGPLLRPRCARDRARGSSGPIGGVILRRGEGSTVGAVLLVVRQAIAPILRAPARVRFGPPRALARRVLLRVALPLEAAIVATKDRR